MLPELFQVGPIPIRSYGLMLALAFLAGVLYIRWITKKDGKPFEPYLAVAYIMIFGGIIGARLFYVLFHLEDFAGNWGAMFNPFAGGQFGISGMNLYGGVVVALLGSVAYLKWKQMSVLEVFDDFSPALGLGIGFGRIGCFLNGCCFGTPTDLPWGCTFPSGSLPHSVFGDVHVHPAQLYSALYGFGLFVVLHLLRSRKQFVGQLAAITLMAEAVLRFVIEQVRYYEEAMHFDVGVWQPTFNHLISVALFIVGLSIYLIQHRRGGFAAVGAKKD